MSLKRDSVTEWAKRNGDAIAAHRSQDVTSRNNVPRAFGQSVFGLASQIPAFSEYTNSKYTLGLSPAAVLNGNWDSIADRALNVAGSYLGDFINKSLSPDSRKFLEKMDSDKLYGMYEGYRYNHKLEEKGYIGFSYPKEIANDLIIGQSIGYKPASDNRMKTHSVFKVPFYENPTIKESRQPTYASHPIVGRNEPYRLWTGAKPAKVDLKFRLLLPHLMTFGTKKMGELLLSKKFVDGFSSHLASIVNSADTKSTPSVDQDTGLFNDLPASLSELSETVRGVFGPGGTTIDQYQFAHTLLSNVQATDFSTQSRGLLIQNVMAIIAMIKGSVISTTTSNKQSDVNYFSAPVAFLTFGGLYNDDPFIVTNYSITFDGKLGYEELSLLPRSIDISLTLESYNQFSTQTPGVTGLGAFVEKYQPNTDRTFTPFNPLVGDAGDSFMTDLGLLRGGSLY